MSGGLSPRAVRVQEDIPVSLRSARAMLDEGWHSFGDWLGTGKIATFLREYRSFEDARSYVRSLGLPSEILRGARSAKSGALPADIPTKPSRKYADKGWQGFGDWLGTGTIATFLREYRSFEDARI